MRPHPHQSLHAAKPTAPPPCPAAPAPPSPRKFLMRWSTNSSRWTATSVRRWTTTLPPCARTTACSRRPSRTSRPKSWRVTAASTRTPSHPPTDRRRRRRSPSTSFASPSTMASTIRSPGCTRESSSSGRTTRRITSRSRRPPSIWKTPPVSGITALRRTRAHPRGPCSSRRSSVTSGPHAQQPPWRAVPPAPHRHGG